MYKKVRLCNTIIIIFFTVSSPVVAQLAPAKYWVQFTDKNNSPYSINSPEEFLSERAIERRNRQQIYITEQDLPVNRTYIDSLKKLGLEIHNISKWFNGAVIGSTDTALLDTLHRLSFISDTVFTFVKKAVGEKRKINKICEPLKSSSDYGLSERQITMLNGDKLHSEGYKGEGMLIAVLDNGFKNTRDLESFSGLWDNDQIVDWRDFVKDDRDIFSVAQHGTVVLSLIGGVIPGYIHGSAPNADFVLVRTEDSGSEYLIEEYNWLSGAEYADSIGADVINSSLGYSEFENPAQDHTYSDLDGQTIPVTIAAKIAAKKGMLVVTSAGNSGNDAWYYITAPADADSILAVGAVDSSGIITYFSSNGPSFDKRIKPDIVAMGELTFGQISNGTLNVCNGTSCSSPIIAGFAACLWQAFPNATSQQIREAMIKSSDRYSNPDNNYGYGLPDLDFASQYLSENLPASINKLIDIAIRPNPVGNSAFVDTYFPNIERTQTGTIEIYDISGKLVNYENAQFRKHNSHKISNTELLDRGFYILRIFVTGHSYQIPFIKN